MSGTRIRVLLRDRYRGFGRAGERLTPLQPKLVVLEASSGYEGVVAAALTDAGLPVAIVNARQVREFAGRLAGGQN